MAFTVLRAQVRLENVNHVPEDAFVNTFHFKINDADPAAQCVAIGNDLASFYATDTEQVSNAQPAGERSIMNYLGPQIDSSNLHTLKVYDLSDAKPRTPIYERVFNFNQLGPGYIPNEVAICLSYRVTPASGVNRARTRGRVFLGPVSTRAVSGTGSDARVATNARNVIAKAAAALALSPPEYQWCVYSPTTDALGPTLYDSAFEIDEGYVDDAFDIQRRRGVRSSARTLWT